MEVYEGRDKRGRRIMEYLIHFQGWNSSWDRRVAEELVLKDTPENRQLQKDLADKSQLQFVSNGAYLYRRKRNNKFEEKMARKDDPDCVHSQDTESYSSSAESNAEAEDKVVLRLSEGLKRCLEQDFVQVKLNGRLCQLPAKVSVITCLENYVKHTAVKFICGTLKRDKLKRRNSQTKPDRDHVVDPDKFTNNLNVSKEVADGLRIYFDFTLRDFLLYGPEQRQHDELFTEEFLATYKHLPCDRAFFLDQLSQHKPLPEMGEGVSLCSTLDPQTEESARRRLRSHRTDDCDFSLPMFESGLSGSESCQSSVTMSSATLSTTLSEQLKAILPPHTTLPFRVRQMLQNTLGWELLPKDAPVEPSMVYGATHLARLIVKLPDFLSATNIAEDKLRLILKHLDDFLE